MMQLRHRALEGTLGRRSTTGTVRVPLSAICHNVHRPSTAQHRIHGLGSRPGQWRPDVRTWGLRIRENYSTAFHLDAASEELLTLMLSSGVFCKQIAKETGVPEDRTVEFVPGCLFVPVPWSPQTRKGMPQEFEQYHGVDSHRIVNVPPNFMFKANVLTMGGPSRLCAVFKVVPLSAAKHLDDSQVEVLASAKLEDLESQLQQQQQPGACGCGKPAGSTCEGGSGAGKPTP